jgi:hypothetical protein
VVLLPAEVEKLFPGRDGNQNPCSAFLNCQLYYIGCVVQRVEGTAQIEHPDND